MTPERRAEIEALLAAITPGMWQQGQIEDIGVFGEHLATLDSATVVDGNERYLHSCNTVADAAFVAESPAIIRELLTEIDRLSSVVLEAIEHDAIPYDQRNDQLMALYDAILPYYRARHPEAKAELDALIVTMA